MEKIFNEIITYCNNYIRDNPFLSVIAFGILTNFLTDIVKIAFAKSLTGSVIFSKFLSKKLLINGIKGYEIQLREINRYKENPLRVMSEYLAYLYQNFALFLLLIITLYVLTNFIKDDAYLYSFYGASTSMAFRIIFGTMLYSSTLDNLLYRIDKYEEKTKLILSRLNTLKESKLQSS